MLAALSIRDIVLIDALDLAFGRGLSILTGETGAGKSILLDAFALALGARGDGNLVRHGEAQGHVTAVFDVPAQHPVWQKAQELGLTAEPSDGDFILRRVQFADGKTKAFVNDQPTSMQGLRQLGSLLVEIHGQHDDRALVDTTTHRALVDGFGGHESDILQVREAYSAWRRLNTDLSKAKAHLDAAQREADFLSHAGAELTKLNAQKGEEAALANERASLMQAEKVAGDLRDALEEIAGNNAPYARLASVLRQLERRRAAAPLLLEPPIAALDVALQALDNAQASLEGALQATNFDPQILEKLEERLFAIRGAARKYGCDADGLSDKREAFDAALAALDHDSARVAALTAAVEEALKTYHAVAHELSEARQKAASALESAVMAELAPLKLERARFLVHLSTDDTCLSAEGYDSVEFWVETNPGTRPGPMMKVASGGELARFMLALKVALADRGSAPTLVFDEIDTGVGGAVADAIGERLARLAKRVQVLAVTHAPQVAAKAASHLRIAKAEVLAKGVEGAQRAVKGKAAAKLKLVETSVQDAPPATPRLATRVEILHEAARQEEIARMLSGATITDEARAAAGRLLQNAS